MNSDIFEKQRRSCLSGVDLSRKGSLDKPIEEVVGFINKQDNYFTTSSCSGRILVFVNDSPSTCSVKKKGCVWLFTSHEKVEADKVIESLANLDCGQAVFKFEPFVLHVQCHHLEDAQKIHASAIGAGFRNSGISIGFKGKIIAAVRSTHSLEVPLSQNGQLLVGEEYLRFLVNCANEKMDENLLRIQRFFNNFKEMISSAANKMEEKGKKSRKSSSKKAVCCKHDKACMCVEACDPNNKNSTERHSGDHGEELGADRQSGEDQCTLISDLIDNEELSQCFLFENT